MSYALTAARQIAARYTQAGNAVYGGPEPSGEALARSYKWWRQQGRKPREAVDRACLDYFRRDARWPHGRRYSAPGAPFGSDKLRWCEDPAAIGFRFVGFADELARLNHRGWFTDSDGWGEVLRGAVYQLPARKGRARLVAAYREGEEVKLGWTDTAHQGAAAIATGEVFESDDSEDVYWLGRGDKSAIAFVREAARRADGIAESYAEEQREYNEAYQAGAEYSQLGDDVESARQTALALLAERRKVPTLPPMICETLRGKVESLLAEIREAREKRAELRDNGWRGELVGAFNDGAGETVIS